MVRCRVGIGIVFGDLLFTATNRLIIIRRMSRPDTPHLCVLFETKSGEIDLHLKYESARNDKTSTYEPLIKFSKSGAEQFIEHRVQALKAELFDFLSRSGRRTRPGWLTKHGYLIALIDEAAFKSSMYAAAPKKRGKHRVNLEKLGRLFANVDPSLITLLEPSVLHTLEMQNYRGNFFAVSSRGKRRLIPLRYIPWGSTTPAWIGLDGLAKEFPLLMNVMVPAELREQAKIIWYRIYDALRLDEVGLTRD
jgi:hypothetical protein